MKMVPEAEAYYSKHQYAILYLVPEFDEAVIFTQRSVYSYPEFILYHSVDEASRDFFRAVQRDRFVPEALRRGVEGPGCFWSLTSRWVAQRNAHSRPTILDWNNNYFTIAVSVLREGKATKYLLDGSALSGDADLVVTVPRKSDLEEIRMVNVPIARAGACAQALSSRLEELFVKYDIDYSNSTVTRRRGDEDFRGWVNWSLICYPIIGFLSCDYPLREGYDTGQTSAFHIRFQYKGFLDPNIVNAPVELLQHRLLQAIPALLYLKVGYTKVLEFPDDVIGSALPYARIHIWYDAVFDLESDLAEEGVRTLTGVFFWEMCRAFQVGDVSEELGDLAEFLLTFQMVSAFLT